MLAGLSAKPMKTVSSNVLSRVRELSWWCSLVLFLPRGLPTPLTRLSSVLVNRRKSAIAERQDLPEAGVLYLD